MSTASATLPEPKIKRRPKTAPTKRLSRAIEDNSAALTPPDSLNKLARTWAAEFVIAGAAPYLEESLDEREEALWDEVVEDFSGLLGRPLTERSLRCVLDLALTAMQDAAQISREFRS